MPLQLHAHAFSSYCQKALTALYENATPFDYIHLGDAAAAQTLRALWPINRFPVLVDNGRTIAEASIIIEHLQLAHPGPVRLLPDDARAALDVRFMDRFFDLYVHTPMQKIVADRIRAEPLRDAHGVIEARALLDTAYRWLEDHLGEHEWATASGFSLADCAAAPALFYADWTHPIAAEFTRVHAYRKRLLARPSFARAVDEARPFRSLFPLGAPDRD